MLVPLEKLLNILASTTTNCFADHRRRTSAEVAGLKVKWPVTASAFVKPSPSGSPLQLAAKGIRGALQNTWGHCGWRADPTGSLISASHSGHHGRPGRSRHIHGFVDRGHSTRDYDCIGSGCRMRYSSANERPGRHRDDMNGSNDRGRCDAEGARGRLGSTWMSATYRAFTPLCRTRNAR